jgi:hypothetical protein
MQPLIYASVPLWLLTRDGKKDETSELVRQLFLRFYSHVYSQFRGVCQAAVWA